MSCVSPGVRVVAVAAAATVVAGGCGGTTRRYSPTIYQGSAKGVSMTLSLAPERGSTMGLRQQSTLTFQFSAAGDALWRRAVHAGTLEAFCIWPHKNGGGMNRGEIRLNSKQRTQTFRTDAAPSTGAYTCGLHVRTERSQEASQWPNYVRGALVAARLTVAPR